MQTARSEDAVLRAVMLLVPFMAIKIRVIRSIFMFGIVSSAVVPSKGQAGLIGQQGISLYEKGPQKAQK